LIGKELQSLRTQTICLQPKPQKKPYDAGETPALPVDYAKAQWSAGVPPAVQAVGSPTAAFPLSAHMAFAVMIIHGAHGLNLGSPQEKVLVFSVS
jgi:hypothetical protein